MGTRGPRPVKRQAERKLTVILHADVVGSADLVQKHETLAHERMQRAFRVLADIIGKYGGNALEIRGDALVADFSRASDAVPAALAFQQTVSQRWSETESVDHPGFRIGIALGEVVIGQDAISGAGVILAQRLEQLAMPGGICIQGAAADTVPRRMPFEYHDLGERQLKGFELPVRAYRVSLREGASVPVPEPSESGQNRRVKVRRRWVVAGGASFLGVVLLSATQMLSEVREKRPGSISPPVSAVAEVRPTIAILPFTNMSEEREQAFFADGITDDLITDLSRIPGLLVISRTSSFAYKGRSEDIRRIAESLGARYMVEGSARRAGEKLRINVQLIDAQTGHHLWAERYDGSMTEFFDLQNAIAGEIAGALDARAAQDPSKILFDRNPASLEAYDVFLQGSGTFQRFSRADTFRARDYFERAIEIDPGFSRAHAMLAWTHVFEYNNGWARDPDETLDLALKIAERAISMDDRSPIAHFVKGLVLRERKAFDRAMVEARRAIEIEPSYANGYVLNATLLYYAGQPEKGLEMLETASRLNPLHPSNYPFHKGQALFILGRYGDAADEFRFGLNQNPTSQRLRVWLAATYAQMGLYEEALWEAEEVLASDPDFDPAKLESIFPFQSDTDLQRFNQALGKAGFSQLPEAG